MEQLFRKLLALEKGEQKTSGVAWEVMGLLRGIGFEYGEHGPVDHVFHCLSQGGGAVVLYEDGSMDFPDELGSPEQAIIACLADLLNLKVNSLKRRNRQIRDLRRALRK